MANGSAGALFLQVKLDTAGAERELVKLGRSLTSQIDPSKTTRQVSQALVAQYKAAAVAQKASAQESSAAARQATADARVQAEQLKVQAAQAKASADAEKAQARTAASITAQRNAQTRATAALAVEQAKVERVTLQDQLLRRRQGELQAIRQQTAALREARAEAERLAKVPGLGQAISGASTAGLQDAFVGFGAARSGNVGYGLAAVVRGLQGVTGAAAGASAAVIATTAAVVGVGLVSLAAAASVGALANALVRAGTEGAESFELLQIQLTSLLGSASKGQQEFQWLLDLGKTSIVPTQALIEADRTLLSFGVTADNVRRSLVSFISEFGTAVGATQDQIYFLSLAVSQVVAKGRADTVDLRQIANAGVNTQKLLQTVGEQTNRTYSEMTAALSEGKLTADQLLLGLITYGKQFSAGADAASQSVFGLKQNLQDVFATSLNTSFLAGGVLDPIKDFLKTLSTTLAGSKGLFDNLAASARNLFDAILGGSGAKNAVGFLDTLFRDVLPGAINGIATLIRTLRPAFEAVYEGALQVKAAVVALLTSLAPLLPGLVTNLKIVAGSFLVIVQAAAITGIVIVTSMTVAVRAVRALFLALTGNFGAAFAEIRQGFVDLATGALRVNAIVAATAKAFKGADAPGVASSDNARQNSAERRRGDTGGIDPNAVAADTQEQAAAAQKAAQQIAQARDSLYQLLRSTFGQPSTALAGLFGDGKAFTATASSIASSAQQIIDALSNIPGTAGLAGFVKDQTRQLLALAKEREAVTKKLEDAEAKLKGLISDRDSLIQRLKDQAQSFVFNLNVGQTTAFRRLDGAGSFAQTTVPESFAASVKRRLSDYKKFVSNIRKLQKAGLDKTIIRQFLEAGPEAAGAIVAQVVSGGSSVITDLNNAQRDLTKLAKEFGIEQGGIFYNAGIAQAQNIVDGLTARQAAIDAAAKKAANAILNAVKPLAAKMKDAGADAAAALASGLSDLGSLPDLSFGGEDLLDGLFPDEAAIKRKAETLVTGLLDVLGASGTIRALTIGGQALRRAILSGLQNLPVQAGALVARTLTKIGATIVTNWPTVVPDLQSTFGAILSYLPTPANVVRQVRELFPPVLSRLRGFKDSIDRVGIWKTLTSSIPTPGAILARVRGLFTNKSLTTFLSGLGGFLTRTVGDPWDFLLEVPTYGQLRSKLMVLADVFRSVINAVIRSWNALDLSVEVPDWLKYINPLLAPIAGKKFDLFPNIAPISLANGGISTAPTLAVVGDNRRAPEVTMALTRDNIAKFAEGVGLDTVGGVTQVRVFIGDRELTDIVRTEVTGADSSTRTTIRSRPRY